MNREFKYKVLIETSQKTVEWKTDDLSPRNLEGVVNIEQFDGDTIVYGEVTDLETGETRYLSANGNWEFVTEEEYNNEC